MVYFLSWLSCVLGPEYDEDLHEEISVQQILREMLDKEVVEKDIMNDLGFDGHKQRRDPRPKMELRHKQVLYYFKGLSVFYSSILVFAFR